MPAPTRRRARPEEVEDETPRRRRPADDDMVPRRRRPPPEPPADEGDEEDFADSPPARRAAPRAADRDEEEEERPRRRPGGPRGPAGSAGRRPGGSRPKGRVASGWGGYNKVKAASGDFETKFKPSKDGDVIALLEGEPFAAFARHWVDLEEGKRAFICPASLEVDEDDDAPECPLCDVGDKANGAKAYLNVAILHPGEKPEHAVWEFGGTVSEQLQTIDKSIGRRSQLTDIFILASSSGSGLNTKYKLEPLFEEDLEEFEVKPLTDKQRNAFELYDAELYEVVSLTELNKIADQIA